MKSMKIDRMTYVPAEKGQRITAIEPGVSVQPLWDIQRLADAMRMRVASLSRILGGRSKCAANQICFAMLAGTTPQELFGAYMHPSLRLRGPRFIRGRAEQKDIRQRSGRTTRQPGQKETA